MSGPPCGSTPSGRSASLESSDLEGRPRAGSRVRYLVCFAVPQEARFFAPPPGWPGEILVTGMGPRKALETVNARLSTKPPDEVLTCGFAGGLNPNLRLGDLVWEADEAFSLGAGLARSVARRGRFHCASRVAVTAAEKSSLWSATGADAVEMESGTIREFCRERGIRSATVRVISDPAGEDLPLDFNALITPQGRMNYAALAWALLRRPGALPRLTRFQKEVAAAAQSLDALLRGLFQF
jgi:adenosylhomocysteine nucleosidase